MGRKRLPSSNDHKVIEIFLRVWLFFFFLRKELTLEEKRYINLTLYHQRHNLPRFKHTKEKKVIEKKNLRKQKRV